MEWKKGKHHFKDTEDELIIQSPDPTIRALMFMAAIYKPRDKL